MNPVTIRPITYDDIERDPTAGTLWAEYAEESAIPELGGANPQPEIYRALESGGMLHILGAYQGETLIGTLSILVAVLPHFGKRTAKVESFFVRKGARRTGAGLMLLREAERLAKELGAVGLFVSTPTGGRLADVIDGLATYRETNRVFFRGFE